MYNKIGFYFNLTLVMAVVTFGLIYYFFSPENVFVNDVLNMLVSSESKTSLILILIFVAACNLVLLATALTPGGPATTIPIINENGRIEIEISAIEEKLTRSIQSREEVQNCRIQVLTSENTKNPIEVKATVAIWDKPSISTLEITEHLQSILKQRFEEILIIDSEVVFNVLIRKLPEPSGKRELPANEVEPPPFFRGPQYPDKK